MVIFGSSLSLRNAIRSHHFREWFSVALAGIVFLATALAETGDSRNERLKIAFELTSDSSFDSFVSNVEGVKENFEDLAEITVVATSAGVELFRESDNSLHPRLAKLADQGVDFVVGSDGLEEREMTTGDLLGFARTVRSGRDEIEQLTTRGWARVPDGETYVSHL